MRNSKSEIQNPQRWANVLRLRNVLRFGKTVSINEKRQTKRFSQPTNDNFPSEFTNLATEVKFL